jgi:hypothetical protein
MPSIHVVVKLCYSFISAGNCLALLVAIMDIYYLIANSNRFDTEIIARAYFVPIP